jgi:phosphomannomutase
MQLAASIFKAYDIRGIVPSTVDEAVAEALGRAFGTVALREGETTVAVGRDGRLSGPGIVRGAGARPRGGRASRSSMWAW